MTQPNHSFKIVTPEDNKRALVVLAGLDLSSPWRFGLKPWKSNRSLEQQALYRVWVRLIADGMAMEEAALHEEFKERYVVEILRRDDEDFAMDLLDLETMFGAAEKAARESKDWDPLAKFVILTDDQVCCLRIATHLKRRVSTTMLDTKQFSEMMDEIWKFAVGMNIVLPEPEYDERKKT